MPTQKPYYKTSYVGLWPDPLLSKKEYSLIKGDSEVFWISVYVPENTPSGVYQGVVELKSKEISLKRVPIKVRVYDFALPQTFHLKTSFDFYENIVPKFYPRKKGESYEKWQLRVKNTIHDFYLMMLHYRISPVFNFDPLEPDFYGSVEKYSSKGLNAFGIGKLGGSFGNNWKKSNREEILTLYRKYAAVLRKLKILDQSYIYTWDEGNIGNPEVQEIASQIHFADPGLKNMVCYHGFWDPDKNPEWGKEIDIWCCQIASFDEKLKARLESMGKEIWLYISGPDNTYPNFGLDFPGLDARIVPWLCWKYGVKGLLYWCVNFWTVNPYENATNTDWSQNGNGLLLYPGSSAPEPSLRLELIRDGLEDYEYLYLLKEIYDSVPKSKLIPDKIKEIEDLLSLKKAVTSLSDFKRDPKELRAFRKKVAESIIELKKEKLSHG